MKALVMPKTFTKKQCNSIISFHTDWFGNKGYVGSNEDRRIDTSIRQCIIYTPQSAECVPNWLIKDIFKTIYVNT